MKSYLKFLSRNKLYTAIEAVGLIVSLAFVILIGSYVVQQYQVAHENPDWKRIYSLGTDQRIGLGFWDKEELEMNIPEVEKVCRISFSIYGGTIEFGGEKMQGRYPATIIADPELFELFPYLHWVEGSASNFRGQNVIAVSESFAHELLRTVQSDNMSSLLGREIRMGDSGCKIVGVLQDLKGTFLSEVCIIRITKESDEEKNFNSLGNCATLYRIRADIPREEADAKIIDLVRKNYEPTYGDQTKNWHTWRFDEIFWNGEKNSGFSRQGNKQMVYMLTLVVLMLLLSAIFNYINLNFALSGKRAKEMATRRLLGESSGGILWKIIAESVAFTAVCFAGALVLAKLLVPFMNELLGTEVTLSIDSNVRLQVLLTPGYIAAYILAVLVLGAVNGLVPALATSRFQPIDVIKGTLRRKNRMVFSRVFIIIQNILAVMLIALGLVMEAQMKYMLERPTHSRTENLFYVYYMGITYDQTKLFKDKIEQLPFVTKVGMGSDLPGMTNGSQNFLLDDGTELKLVPIIGDTNYFNLMGLEIQEDFRHPIMHSVWLGQTAYRAANISDTSTVFARKFNFRGVQAEYIGGVVADFPSNSAAAGDEGILNVCVIVAKPEETFFSHNLLIETIGECKEYEEQILKAYKEYQMEQFGIYQAPFRAGFLRDVYKQQLAPACKTMRLLELFAALSVLVALLGLLAMSTYFADDNTKQIAIRKVFGSDVTHETWRNVQSYMVLVGVACAIGIPLAVWAARLYLERFAYRIENYGWLFVVAILISMIIAFVSVIWQVISAARTNPAEALKKE
jgi:putative ABC transport system permease protein